VHDPRRTIPRAILITITGAVLLYTAVASIALGAVGAQAMAATAAPLHASALAFGPAWVAAVVSVGGVTAMLGVILSQLLGLSRMVFAMARRGDLPAALAHVHPQHGVPDRAVLGIGALAALVAATGTLRAVASAASFTILVYYAIANLAALRMPKAARLYPGVVPVLGLATCVLLASSLAPGVVATGIALLAAGMAFRLLRTTYPRQGN
jgi:APA family basic amino acid/polyamine antiporter